MNNTQFDQFNGYNTVSGVETITGKKKGKKAAVIGGITAAALVGGCASAYAFSDTVKNQVNLRTMKPEKYYAWVCENNGTEFAKKASASYEKGIKKIENGTGVSYNISYEMPDSVKSMLKDEMGGDDETAAIIDNINKIKIDMNGALGEAGMNYNIGAFLNDDKLATIDYNIDFDNMGISLRCPELTEKWITVDTESLAEEITYDENTTRILEFYKDFLGDPSSVLSPQQVEDEVNKYIGVWNNTTKDVTIEKKETIDICDIQVNYTVVEVPVTADMAKEMGTNFLNELKNDDVAKSIIVDRLGVSAEDFTSDLEDALTDISNSEGGDDTVTFRTYVDPTGQIRGISMAADGEEFKAIIGKEGDQIRGEFSVPDEMTATLTATEGSDKTYSGKLDVTENEETVTFDFDGFKVVNEEDGYFEGTVTANVPDSDPIKLTFETDGSSQNIIFDINVEGENYGKLTLGYAVTNGENVSIPDKSNAFVLNEETMNTFEPEDYVTQEEVESFLTDIMTKVGIKDAAEASKSVAGMLYGGGMYGSDMYDDYDFDESDWDDEDFNGDDEDFEDFDFDTNDFSTDSSRSTAGSYSIDGDEIKIEIPEVPSININTDLT